MPDNLQQQHPWEEAFVSSMVRHREALGLSQTGLAKRLAAEGLPFHPQTVQRIEAGERPIRLNEAVLIVRALEMSDGESLGLDAVAGGSRQQALFTLAQTTRACELHLSEAARTFERDSDRAAELSSALLKAMRNAEVPEGSSLEQECQALRDRLSAYVDAFTTFEGGDPFSG